MYMLMWALRAPLILIEQGVMAFASWIVALLLGVVIVATLANFLWRYRDSSAYTDFHADRMLRRAKLFAWLGVVIASMPSLPLYSFTIWDGVTWFLLIAFFGVHFLEARRFRMVSSKSMPGTS